MRIWDEHGRWCKEKESIAQVAVAYFENIYTTDYPTWVEEVVAAIPTRVLKDMNESLTRAFTREEVAIALKQIHPTKAPRPDGMSAFFYIKNTGTLWEIM